MQKDYKVDEHDFTFKDNNVHEKTVLNNIRYALRDIENKGLKPSNLSIFISDKTYYEALGWYSRDEIVIATNNIDTIYHEIGHVIAWEYNLYPYFREIRESQGVVYNDNEWETDHKEDFAEEFARILVNRKKKTSVNDMDGFEEWLINEINKRK